MSVQFIKILRERFGLERMTVLIDLSRDQNDSEGSATFFLLGEIQAELGDFDAARSSFQQSAKKGKKGAFVDDAELTAIRALEALGKNEEAAKEWGKWEKKHPKSPLMPEAKLAQASNALRRSNLEETSRRLEALWREFPWMRQDSRAVLAAATVGVATRLAKSN